jgi:hypothetical protein
MAQLLYRGWRNFTVTRLTHIFESNNEKNHPDSGSVPPRVTTSMR